MPKQNQKNEAGMRLDKWLWCARFYKTRNLASDSIKSGKVTINSERAKPSRTIKQGDRLCIRRGPYIYDVEILLLAKNRKSASDAALLYQESPSSKENREQILTRLKLDAMNTPRTSGRPTKRNRRQLIRFKTSI